MTNPTTRYSHIEPEHQGKSLSFKQVAPGEVEHHGGSFRKYMDNKNKKLQEQFDQQSAVAAAYGDASGHAVSDLFSGVSIMVNGFTTPSQQDLKQIMAQHGGNFEIYYHRGLVTHIICSNLTDAKVKIFQRERNPTPVVRPEWIVDSLKAGAILPLEEYVLWRLRDVPGQRTLSSFRQQPGTATQAGQRPIHITEALPPSPYGKFPSSAADSNIAPSTLHQSAHLYNHQQPAAWSEQHTVNAPNDTPQHAEGHGSKPAKALDFDHADAAFARVPAMPEAELDSLSNSHATDVLPGTSNSGPSDQNMEHYQHNIGGSAVADDKGMIHDGISVAYDGRSGAHDGRSATHDGRSIPHDGRSTAFDIHDSWQWQDAQQMQPPPKAPAGSSSGAAAPPATEYRVAHERAAAARAACDLLRGPPKSSRDDPHFMDSYYKSSRLSFIGRWKARVEALTATMAAGAPLPKAVQPTSALLYAFKADKGTDSSGERAIIHLDMDCFFASVASLAEPAFKGKPLAVSHSNSAQGTGEISSANYEARKFGIRASMFIAEAKKRCPHLIVMPYQFDKYEEVSEQVYRILLKATACVQPVSCDEAYLDVTGLGDPEEVSASIRQQIFEATGCTASAGIGPSMLVARLATKKGKPDGQFRIHSNQVDEYLLDLEVDELPGVGWNMCHKLKDLGIASVRDVRHSSRDVLQRELGSKTGSQVWAYAHGIDERQVEPPKSRKSVGAECNWGIRFQNDADAVAFMDNLAGELSTRMKAAGVKGRTISLKLKRRKTNAPDPPKFMGHGDCDNMSRSVTLSRFTDSPAELASQGKALLRALRVDPTQIRGIGLNVTKLDTDPASAAAKPGSAAPAKVMAPPPSTHDPKTGSWVRFWQDKPQHWGVPPTVKSPLDLAAANINRTDPPSPFKPDADVLPVNVLQSACIQDEARHSDRQPSRAPVSCTAQTEGSKSLVAAAVASEQQAPAKSNSHSNPAVQPKARQVLSSTVAAKPDNATSHAHATALASATAFAAAASAPALASPKSAAFNMYSPSKGTLQVLHKPPSKEPSPKKQAPLDQMLSRQAAQAQSRAQPQAHALNAVQQQQTDNAQVQGQLPDVAEGTVTAEQPASASASASIQPVSRVVLPHAVQLPVQTHQHAKLQGLTLSQIDASVFAALPAEHQQELLQNLPKTSSKPPSTTSALQQPQADAGVNDFAFVTKLANLQKGGNAGPGSAPASLSLSSSETKETEPQASPERADVGQTSEAALHRPGPCEGFLGGAQALADGPQRGVVSALQASSSVVSASGQGAASKAAGKSTQGSPVAPHDPTFVSQMSDDSDSRRAPSSSSPHQDISRSIDEPAAYHSDNGDDDDVMQEGSMHDHSAQQAQHTKQLAHAEQTEPVQQAQPAPPFQQLLPSGKEPGVVPDAVGIDDTNEMDQALDMDLMEEEWVALAAQGQSGKQSTRPLAPPAGQDQDQLSAKLDYHGGQHHPAQQLPGQANAITAAQQALQHMPGSRVLAQPQPPVPALPPASQIDSSVLDALPLQVRRELELAYGLAPKRSPNKGTKRRREVSRPAAPARVLPAKKQRVLDAPVAISWQAGRLAAHSRMTEAALSYTQLDPSVLSELPQELRDELAAVLPSSNSSRHKQHSAADKSNSAAACLNLMSNGRLLGNKAILMKQQHEHAQLEASHAQPDSQKEDSSNEAVDELWAELHLALQGLSATISSHATNETAFNDPRPDEQAHIDTDEKFDALYKVVLQWAGRQVESSLEDVHYLLRRLVSYVTSCGLVQQGVARLIKAIQSCVESVHGATLQMRQPFV